MPRAALFDWDGTLADSRAPLLAAWHRATEAVLGDAYPVTPEDTERTLTLPGSELFPAVAGGAERGAVLRDAFRSAYRETGAGVRVFPGVPEMLQTLRAHGVLVAVVTSKTRERLELDLGRVGIGGLLHTRVCLDDVRRHKPDPEPVLTALRRLGVGPEAAAMVGDTPVDIAAATAAGATAVGVAWGASGAATLRDAGASTVAQDVAALTALLVA